MKRLLAAVFFLRPLLHFPVWIVYLQYAAFTQKFHYLYPFVPERFTSDLLMLSLIFGGVYAVNQIFDVETDRVNNKLHFLPRNIISIPMAWTIYSIVTACGLWLAIRSSIVSIIIALDIILLGLAYSMPPLRLKDRPLGGLITNALAYGFLIPILAARPLYTLEILLSTVPYVLAIGAGYVFTTIPDREGDSESGKMTVAVIMGAGSARMLGTFLSALACAVSFWLGNSELFLTALCGTILGSVGWLRHSNRLDLFSAKMPILVLLLFTTSHFPLFLTVILLTIILTRLYYKLMFNMTYPKLI